MELVTLMRVDQTSLLAEAEASLARSHLSHYEGAGKDATRERMQRLYEVTLRCLQKKNLVPILQLAEEIGRERFQAGYDLHEVQTVFNVLEETVWRRILARMRPEDYALALGSLSTVLGAGKDSLARAYVSAATRGNAPGTDVASLFGRQ